MEPQEFLHEISTIGDPIQVDSDFNLYFWSLMVFNLVIFALVRTFSPNHIRLLFKRGFTKRQSTNKLGDELNLNTITSILLNLTYFTSIGVIAWRATHSDANNFVLILAGMFFVVAFLKQVIIQLLIFFTNTKIGFQNHHINHLIFYQIGGIVLTPVLIFTEYLPAGYHEFTLLVTFILVALLIVSREFQSFMRAMQYKVSFFYIILYLCTLELLPLLIGIRALTLNNGVFN